MGSDRDVDDGGEDQPWHLEHDAEAHKFVLRREGESDAAGPVFIEYARRGWATLDLFETFVPPRFRGHGLAEKLAHEVFAFAKARGLRIIASCTYLSQRFLARHPQFATLIVPQLHQPLECAKARLVTWDPRYGHPERDSVHLMPFLLPTHFCDAADADILAMAQTIIPRDCSTREAAARVRNWAREHITYVLDEKDVRASDTLRKREGMCTNKANLQVALLRAAGVPAGYVITHITRDSFSLDAAQLDSEHCSAAEHADFVASISDPTVHLFCAAYDFAEARFMHFDATEAARGPSSENQLLEEDAVTGESQFQSKFLRGPWGPVQANIDHLLGWQFSSKLDPQLRARINLMYRQLKL